MTKAELEMVLKVKDKEIRDLKAQVNKMAESQSDALCDLHRVQEMMSGMLEDTSGQIQHIGTKDEINPEHAKELFEVVQKINRWVKQHHVCLDGDWIDGDKN